MDFQLVVVAAFLIEAVVTTITWIVENGFQWKRLTALLLGCLVCVLFDLNLVAYAGLTPAEWLPVGIFAIIGGILTGFLVARGANVVNDLLSFITSLRA